MFPNSWNIFQLTESCDDVKYSIHSHKHKKPTEYANGFKNTRIAWTTMSAKNMLDECMFVYSNERSLFRIQYLNIFYHFFCILFFHRLLYNVLFFLNCTKMYIIQINTHQKPRQCSDSTENFMAHYGNNKKKTLHNDIKTNI